MVFDPDPVFDSQSAGHDEPSSPRSQIELPQRGGAGRGDGVRAWQVNGSSHRQHPARIAAT
jgi:hypothetical protein